MQTNDPKLRETLQAWPMEVTLPEQFNAQVWDRIAIAQEGSPENPWTRWRLWLQDGWIQPRFAWTMAAAVLIVSMLLGQVQFEASRERRSSQLEKSYLASLDPYVKAQEMGAR